MTKLKKTDIVKKFITKKPVVKNQCLIRYLIPNSDVLNLITILENTTYVLLSVNSIADVWKS